MIKREELHLIMRRERKGHRNFKRTIKKRTIKTGGKPGGVVPTSQGRKEFLCYLEKCLWDLINHI